MENPQSDYTLLDVINAVGEFAETDEELAVTLAYLINSGKVKLCGQLAGSKVEIIDTDGTQLGAA